LRDLEIFRSPSAIVLFLRPVCFVGFSMVTEMDHGGAVVDGVDIPGRKGVLLRSSAQQAGDSWAWDMGEHTLMEVLDPSRRL
jgi:hypothetical protein